MTIDHEGRVALIYKRVSSKCGDTDDVTVQRAYVEIYTCTLKLVMFGV